MYVLLFDVFKYLLLRKTVVLKTCRKKYISWRKNQKKCTSFEEQKGTRYIQENLYFGIIFFSCLSSTKRCLRFPLNCIVREIKGFYQSSLANEVDFRDIMNVFPNILAKKQNSKKLSHAFVNERALVTSLISSCHWKTLVPFCLQKKRPENAFLTLIVNYHKIVQKNKLCHSKQQ